MKCNVSVFLLCLAVCGQATAGRFGFDAEVGMKYDSNVGVSVTAIDEGANAQAETVEPDTALSTSVSLSYKEDIEKISLSSGYSLSDNRYTTFNEYDTQIHIGTLGSQYDFGVVKSGVTVRFIQTSLNGHDFLTSEHFSPFVSGFLRKKWYFRAAYTYESKDFNTLDDKDGTTHVYSSDVYHFLDGMKSFVSFGVRHKISKAKDSIYDYSSNQLKFKYSHQIVKNKKKIKLKFGVRYENREYSHIDSLSPIVGTATDGRRRDKKYRLDMSASYPVYKRFSLIARGEYAEVFSGREGLSYDQYVLETQIRYEF